MGILLSVDWDSYLVIFSRLTGAFIGGIYFIFKNVYQKDMDFTEIFNNYF